MNEITDSSAMCMANMSYTNSLSPMSQAAEKEAVGRRASDKQILEDAEHLVAAWHQRQARQMPMLFSSNIGAANVAGY
jgi:hypothetical protein